MAELAVVVIELVDGEPARHAITEGALRTAWRRSYDAVRGLRRAGLRRRLRQAQLQRVAQAGARHVPPWAVQSLTWRWPLFLMTRVGPKKVERSPQMESTF